MERRLRLRSESDFRRVRAAGRSWGHRLMTLVATSNGLPGNRYGFVISKRVGNAVVRNLAKRRLREILRPLDTADRIRPGFDCVFIVRPSIREAPFDEIAAGVTVLLTRASLLKMPPPTPLASQRVGEQDGRS